MDNILPNADFSYDPVTAINENEAKGKTAEIFEDIRNTMNIPLITSIWRGLASMDNNLEDIWLLTKPIYLSGSPELALTNMINNINLPTPSINNHFKDLKKSDLIHIENIVTAYNKSNGMNLMALSALVMSEYKPRVAITNISRKIIVPTFPKLRNKEEISPESWLKVRKINSLGSSQGLESHVATLWRHLSYWPEFLSVIYDSFKSFHENGDLEKVFIEVLYYLNTNGINLRRQKFKYKNITNEALTTIKNYVSMPNQVIRMVVLGNMTLRLIKNIKT
ncbi:hypothetical protein N9423_07560 [Alphaproteobacteria bacterium]|nr:hypothetical protein [Alphaproteobacteria bacterium]